MKVKALGILRCRRKYNFDMYRYINYDPSNWTEGRMSREHSGF